MTRVTLIVWVACSLAGCSTGGGLATLPKYHGAPRAAVVRQLGEPERVAKFRMDEAGPSEFRIALQNTYPLTNPDNAAVLIEEVTWQDGDYWITLWLHRVSDAWVVLDSCRWHKDVRF